jgi:hypothetical protein
MNTQSISMQSPDGHLLHESAARRFRVRRRSAALAPGQAHVVAPVVASPDRPDAARQVGGARILRRWSVAELIARAGGAPRAFA